MHTGCVFVWYTSHNIDHSRCQMIYLTVALDNVDNALQRGFELTNALLLTELDALGVDKVLSECMENWTPPARVINSEECLRALLEGAWNTSYGRYYDWHEQQQERSRNAPHRRSWTAQNRASHQVSPLLNSMQVTNSIAASGTRPLGIPYVCPWIHPCSFYMTMTIFILVYDLLMNASYILSPSHQKKLCKHPKMCDFYYKCSVILLRISASTHCI